jgi:hypothetical protein
MSWRDWFRPYWKASDISAVAKRIAEETDPRVLSLISREADEPLRTFTSKRIGELIEKLLRDFDRKNEFSQHAHDREPPPQDIVDVMNVIAKIGEIDHPLATKTLLELIEAPTRSKRFNSGQCIHGRPRFPTLWTHVPIP